ncbi:MAG TPA: molybdenum cofactor guanylyltransferase [Thermoanaerobaculia bacterium]|nr:molybdenum cofactor guanylyltransferase [Thermoanaerobaculia bacterium]
MEGGPLVRHVLADGTSAVLLMNCYILTGGKSQRMGRSKTAIFLDRVAAAARPVFDDVIAVERAAGTAHDDVRTIFEDPHEHEAPVFGVVRALEHAQGRCFILAVDYPLITSDVLRFLHDRAALAEWNGKMQLLCAVWGAALLPRIEQRIAEGRLDLHGLIEQEIITEAELRRRFGGEPLMNVNTPEELEAAERSYGR